MNARTAPPGTLDTARAILSSLKDELGFALKSGDRDRLIRLRPRLKQAAAIVLELEAASQPR